MDIAKMGGADVYVKYLALLKRSYLITPFSNKAKSTLDYYSIDGAANWGHDIFHYCDMDTLKKITGNKQLRFSDIHSLKDKTEFDECVRILRMAIERNKFCIYNELYDVLTDENILREIECNAQHYPFYPPINQNREIDSVKPICKVYTCSFSMDGDSCYMWKNYAGKTDGVSINFTELKDHMKDNEKVKIVWGKVWYTEEDKIQCIEALLKNVAELFLEIPDKRYRKEMVQGVILSSINNMRIFMKQKDFEPEKEYRAALIIPEEVINNNELPDGYTQDIMQREKIDVPCIDVPFDLECISNIIIKPYGDFDSLNTELKDWLHKQNLNNIRIYSSNVPARKY